MRAELGHSGVDTDLLGVVALDRARAVAVGRGGVILEWDGSRWHREDSHTEEDLYAICAAPSGELFAVGGNLDVGGTSLILRGTGGRWTAERSPVQSVLLSVDADRDRVRAVGFNGDICEYDGSSWRQRMAPTNAHLFCIRVIAGTWRACGLGGVVVEVDGRDAHASSICEPHLTSLAELDDDRLLAVGFDGTMVVRTAGAWHALASPTRQHLWSACSIGAGRWLAVGARGTVVADAQLVDTPTAEDLHAVSSADGGAIAVGRHGAVVHAR